MSSSSGGVKSEKITLIMLISAWKLQIYSTESCITSWGGGIKFEKCEKMCLQGIEGPKKRLFMGIFGA